MASVANHKNMLSCARILTTFFWALSYSVSQFYTHACMHTRTCIPSDGATLPNETHQYYDTGSSDNQTDNSSDNGTNVHQWEGLHSKWGRVTVVANSLSRHGLNLEKERYVYGTKLI